MFTLILPKILISVTHNQTDVVKHSLKISFYTISRTDSLTAILFWMCMHCVSIWTICLFIKYLLLKRGSDMISNNRETEHGNQRQQVFYEGTEFLLFLCYPYHIQYPKTLTAIHSVLCTILQNKLLKR